MRLLGRFTVAVDGSWLALSRAAQRLLARIALTAGGEERGVLAGTLWPEHPEHRAQANLRGLVWRLPAAIRPWLAVGPVMVAFENDWQVDLHEAERQAAGIAMAMQDPPAPVQHLPPAALFRDDLLPDWDEPWLVVVRERHRQLRLHALEDLTRAHLRAGRPFDAVDSALLAASAEPLRESAQHLLVQAHLQAGNRAVAGAAYERFQRMLAVELGVVPSPELTDLVQKAHCLPRARTQHV